MKKLIKAGVLSYGMSGSLFHCPFLKLHEGFELVGIVERSKKKAAEKYPDIKSYDSVEAILNEQEIELVVVNTPSPTHFEFALKAIQAKKHVLVEKPFTVTSEEAKVLFAEAKKNDVHVLAFQNRRYDSDFLSVKNILASGELGDLIEVHFRYDRYNLAISDNVQKESDMPGNGLLYNLGPHVIDAAIALFGVPDEFRKFKKGNRPGTKIDDYASIQFQYKNGLQVFLTVSLLVADAQKAFVLHGTRGTYVKNRSDVQEEQLKLGLSPASKGFGVEIPDQAGILTIVENSLVHKEKISAPKSTYLNIFQDVFETIRNNKPYPVTEGQIIKQMEILED